MTRALESRPAISDGDLAIAAASGDRQAFAEIYDRYADRLYDFCVGLIGDRDAAADCVQDAFCVAATDLGNLREPDRLRPWLYQIARHHAMRRLRHRYREEVSDDLPDMASSDAGPETLARQSELARLVADAAGGLTDRDRELLDLSYRHGLDGPELAEALGVSLTNANTLVFRLRQTVERCLGALLVARGAQANPDACPELAAVLKGWDGQFSVLMRKRVARHIDSCQTCAEDQRRNVNPVSLLGATAVFIPAPAALRRRTLDQVQLTCASSDLASPDSPEDSDTSPSAPSADAGTPDSPAETRKFGPRMALIVVIPLVCLILAIAWFARPEDPVARVDTGTESSEGPPAVLPATLKGPPLPTRETTAGPAVPTLRSETAPGPSAPTVTPGANTPASAGPAPAPAPVLPSPAPAVAPAPAPVVPAPVVPAPVPDPAPSANTDGGKAKPAAPALRPNLTNPKAGTTESTGGTTSNPNTDTKVGSSYPQQPNTGTVTNPNATLPKLPLGTSPNSITSPSLGTGTITNPNKLQIGTVPKPNTNLGTGPGTNSQTSQTKQ